MSLADVQHLVRTTPAANRRYRLFYTFPVYVGPVLSGLAFGVLAPLAISIGLGRIAEPGTLAVAVVVSALLSVVVAVRLRATRQGPVTIELDEDGIRELDGDDVRVAIPWEDAHAWSFQQQVSPDGFRTHVRFVAPNGDVIAITNQDDGWFFPQFRFRCHTDRGLGIEHEIALALPSAPETPVDPRDQKEHGTPAGRFFARLAAWAGYAWTAGYVAVYGVDPSSMVFFPYDAPVRAFFMLFFGIPPLVLLVRDLRRSEYWLIRTVVLQRAVPAVTGDYRTAAKPAKEEDPRARYIERTARRARIMVALRFVVFALCAAYPWVAGEGLEAACLRQERADCPR